MGKMPFFSVVIPVYNKAPHISRSINSVLNQTFNNFEIIIINDASTDVSVKEIEKIYDPRIRLLHRSQPGPGGYAARNLGIKESRADWIAFLDADDEWFSCHLEEMHLLCCEFKDVYFMSCGWITLCDGSKRKNKYYTEKHSTGRHILKLDDYLLNCIKQQSPVCTSVAVVSKKATVVNNLFPSEFSVQRGGDQHAWLKIMLNCKNLAWSNHIGATYYRNSVNMTTRTTASSPELYTNKVYCDLGSVLNKKELLLLSRYFNMKLKEGWLGNIRRSTKNYKLYKYLYWKGDFIFAFKMTLLSTIPDNMLRALVALRSAIRTTIPQ